MNSAKCLTLSAILALTFGSAASAAALKHAVIAGPHAKNTTISGISDAGLLVGNYYNAGNMAFTYDSKAATPVVTPLVAPGTGDPVSDTTVYSISPGGTIVGSYFSGGVAHGFILSGGTWTTLDYAGSVGTTVSCISANGAYAAGSFSVPGRGSRGYIYNTVTGVFTAIDFSGLGFFGDPRQIDNDGNVIGTYYDTSSFVNRTFQASTAAAASNFAPVSGATCEAEALAQSGGEIVGLCYNPQIHGVIVKNGVATLYDIPGSSLTTITALNANGDIAGQTDVGGVEKAYVQHSSTVRYVSVRGTATITVTGLNASGQASGYFAKANGIDKGIFIHP